MYRSFQIMSFLVPVAVYYIAPWIVRKYGGEARQHRIWLISACMVFLVSWYIPSPLIEGRDTSFATHFLGGGIFVGMLWVYLKQSLDWRAHWVVELFSLFALVSALGAVNELFELVLYWSGNMSHGIADTSWDILANTLGSFLFYMGYVIVRAVQRARRA